MTNEEKKWICPVCRIFRQKCGDGCWFATAFPQNDSKLFEKLESVVTADNVSILLPTILESKRSLLPCPGCRSIGDKCESDCILAPVFQKYTPQMFNYMAVKYGADMVNRMLVLLLLLSLHHKEDNSQPTIGNSSRPLQQLADESHLVPSLASSVHGPPQQTQQMAKDKRKRVASVAHGGNLVIGNRPQTDNSQSMIGVSAGMASVDIPPQPKRPRRMANETGIMTNEGNKWICPLCWIFGKNCGGGCRYARVFLQNDSNMLEKFSTLLTRILERHHKNIVEGKLMTGNRSQQLPGQQQVWQMAPSANTGQLIIRNPQPHGYRADQQQMARISSADTSQMLTRQLQPHGYPQIADQQQMDQMSRADMHQLLSREPQQHGYTRLQQYPLLHPQQQLQRNQQPYFHPDYHNTELSLQMALPGQQNQQLQLHSDILSSDPCLISQMMVQPQQHQQSHSQEQYSQPALDQQSRSDKGKSIIPSSQDRGQMLITKPQPNEYPRIADQQQMDQMSRADMHQLLSREPQQHGYTLLRSQQQLQRNQQPYFHHDYHNTELSLQMALPGQQNQQLQQNQQPSFPPDHTDSDLSLQIALPGQQNQQLQLHSDIISSDPCLRSQMMVQPQQHQQSHSQARPVLDQRPRSRSDKDHPTQQG